jgi:hypothetical protein
MPSQVPGRDPGEQGSRGASTRPSKDVFKQLLRFSETVRSKKMLRYTLVSVISTVLSFTVLGIVFGVLRLWTQVPSTIFAGMVTMVPNYYLNRSWVWGKTGRSHWRREVRRSGRSQSGVSCSRLSPPPWHAISA